jgi:hypothetical protein
MMIIAFTFLFILFLGTSLFAIGEYIKVTDQEQKNGHHS